MLEKSSKSLKKRDADLDHSDLEFNYRRNVKKVKDIPGFDSEDDISSSDDDALGPSLPKKSTDIKQKKKKKRKLNISANDKFFLEKLPDFPFYSQSFRHKKQVTVLRTFQPQQSSWSHESNVFYGKQSEFLITGSMDGHIVFWCKMKNSFLNDRKQKTDDAGRFEFVKEFKAHEGPVSDIVFSPDGRYIATISGTDDLNTETKIDKTIKIFDVVSFDMINFFELSQQAQCICWASVGSSPRILAALKGSSEIYIYNPALDSPEIPEYVLSHIHKKPVMLINYNATLNCAISSDSIGMIEYWQPQPNVTAKSKILQDNRYSQFSKPSGRKWFDLKSTTNLYDFRKTKAVPTAMAISPNGHMFATFSFPDRKVRIFDFKTGKLKREYDESLQTLSDLYRLETVGKGSDMDLKNIEQTTTKDENKVDEELHISNPDLTNDDLFQKKIQNDELYLEKENKNMQRYQNVLFDESNNYVIFSSVYGIKIVNIHENKVARILGNNEHERFLNLALYQGSNQVDSSRKLTVEAAASDNQLIQKAIHPDPVIFASAFNSSQIFLFSRHPESMKELYPSGNSSLFNNKIPEEVKQWLKHSNRNSFNQKFDLKSGDNTLSKDSKTSNTKQTSKALKAKCAVIYTTIGDMRVKFFPTIAPLAVENFITLSERGVYNHTIFHRVIKGFMIQGGDPEGDGTGGESMWAKETGNPYFKDEFDTSGSIRFDKPFRLSMANSGPNTNGSQFFITTAATPWLDKKHTIFGELDSSDTGISIKTVKSIESLETDKEDRPKNPPEIISINIEY